MNVEVFWSMLEKPDGEVGCWIWPRSKIPLGYGWVYIRKSGSIYAHRLAYSLVNGNIPAGMHVCHTCDNPSCCNPAHLWLGTPRENMHDRDRKGRGTKGWKYEGKKSASPQIVDEIRRLYGTGRYSQRALAKQFSLSKGAIYDILNGKHAYCNQ